MTEREVETVTPKIGDKFIFEIDRIYSSKKHEESRYGIKGFENFVLSKGKINQLLKHGNIKTLNEYDEDGWAATKARWDKIREKGFNEGMEHAWEVAKRYLHDKPSMYCKEMLDIFDRLSPQEAEFMRVIEKPKTNADKFIEVFGENCFKGATWKDGIDIMGMESEWWDKPYEEERADGTA